VSAETLRRAASLMRERAEGATPGPWRAEWLDGTAAMPVDTWAVTPGVAETNRWTRGGINAAHIASWHPAVALAVADWLSDVANRHEASGAEGGIAPVDHPFALTVARSYLGGAR